MADEDATVVAATLPPYHVLLYLRTVQPFWEQDIDAFDEEGWTASRPAIVEEIKTLCAKKKLNIFNHLLALHGQALIEASTSTQPSLPSFRGAAPTFAEIDAYLARPTSILRCRKCVGWDGPFTANFFYHYPNAVEHVSAGDCQRYLWHEADEDVEEPLSGEAWTTAGKELGGDWKMILAAHHLWEAVEKTVGRTGQRDWRISKGPLPAQASSTGHRLLIASLRCVLSLPFEIAVGILTPLRSQQLRYLVAFHLTDPMSSDFSDDEYDTYSSDGDSSKDAAAHPPVITYHRAV